MAKVTFDDYKERLRQAFRQADESAARLEEQGGSGIEVASRQAAADAYSNALSWAESVDEIAELQRDQRLMHGGQ